MNIKQKKSVNFFLFMLQNMCNFPFLTTCHFSRMNQQREALRKSRSRRRVTAHIHSTNLSINRNITINQNIQILENVQNQSASHSPIPQREEHRSPILKEIYNNVVKKPNGRRWSIGILIFSALIYFYSPTAYEIFRSQVPLPAPSTIYKHKNSGILDNSEYLLEVSKLPEILKVYEEENKEDNNSTKKITKAIISVDAVSVTPSNKILKDGTITGLLHNYNISEDELPFIKNSYQKFEELLLNYSKNIVKAAFVFQLQPINHSIPCLLIHVIPANSGKANPSIVSRLYELKKIIEENSFYSIIGFAADGDNSYRHFLNSQVYSEDKLDSILFFSDYLHLLKRGRYWFLKNLKQYSLETNKFKNEFCIQYNLPSIIMSDERITKMHDSLPLRLFDFSVLLKLVNNNQNQIFSYFFPWTLFMISINADQISFNFRSKLLKLSLAYFKKFPRYFNTNLLTDVKGTIISLLKLFQLENETFSINRLSSNPLEHSFGILRMKARNHDSINKFINDIKRVNFIRLHKRDYIKTVIRHRESDFGRIIHPDGDFSKEDLNGLLESIARFISLNQKDQLFENFMDEIRAVEMKSSKKSSDILCSTKDVTLNPSSQINIRRRQEMDHTGRKYCPWTKCEEKKLIDLHNDFNGNINKMIKYFPERSPDSLKQKIKNLKVK